jgi:hypothetical protein
MRTCYRIATSQPAARAAVKLKTWGAWSATDWYATNTSARAMADALARADQIASAIAAELITGPAELSKLCATLAECRRC